MLILSSFFQLSTPRSPSKSGARRRVYRRGTASRTYLHLHLQLWSPESMRERSFILLNSSIQIAD